MKTQNLSNGNIHKVRTLSKITQLILTFSLIIIETTIEGYQQKSDLLLCMISAEASKPAIAAVAQALANRERRRLLASPSTTGQPFKITVDELDEILEGRFHVLLCAHPQPIFNPPSSKIRRRWAFLARFYDHPPP